MSGSSSNKNDRIDLGLSALLSIVSEVSSSPSSQQSEKIDMAVAAVGANSSADDVVLSKLKENGRWLEIIASVERTLDGDRAAESSLWWVRAHLGALSMPVSLLLAPFEKVARDLSSRSPETGVRHLLEETSGILLERLQQVGQREQIEAFQKLLHELKVASVSGELGKHRHAWTLSTEPLQQLLPSLPAAPQGSEPVRKGMPSVAIIALLFIFSGACLLALWAIQASIFSTPTALAFESFVRDSLLPEQEQSTITLRDPAGNLSTLYYSIDQGVLTPVAAATAQVSELAASALSAKAVEPTTKPSTAALKSKDRVNTVGPIEGEEYRSGVTRGSALEVTPERPPSARLPGRDQGVSPFERQERPEVYRVLVRANVVSSPSYAAAVLGQLQPGDEVLVDGRWGAWLRLRSRGGNNGYILAQDAVPENRAGQEVNRR